MANQRALAHAGHEVIGTEDGQSGLEMAREKLPDLILLEMILPKLSGPEVLKALKSDPLTAPIPVIVLSSLSGRNREKLQSAGAAAFIEKSDDLLANSSAALVIEVEKACMEVLSK
jgi:CheY-like chemotaxis protein